MISTYLLKNVSNICYYGVNRRLNFLP